MRRTKAQAAHTKRTILDAATRLFLEVGYENASLDEIAANAGVKRGAVHFHFVNKAGLLSALCEDMSLPMQELAEQLEAEGTHASLYDMDATITSIFSTIDADPQRRGLIRLTMAVELSRSDDHLHAYMSDFVTRVRTTLVAIFRAAEREGQLAMPWSACSAALALHNLVTGFIFDYARRDTGHISDTLPVIRTLLETFAAKRRRHVNLTAHSG